VGRLVLEHKSSQANSAVTLADFSELPAAVHREIDWPVRHRGWASAVDQGLSIDGRIMPLSQGLGLHCRSGQIVSKPGAKRAVVACAADLEHQIGAISRPPHLLRLVHASVDQEVRCAPGDRRSDSQTGRNRLA
jgi:hypothetical protein